MAIMRIDQLWTQLESARNRRVPKIGGRKDLWVLRRATPSAKCPLLVGIELATNRRGLLLEVAGNTIPIRKAWPHCRGLDWVQLPTQGPLALFGVALKDARQADVFSALADDLARRATEADSRAQAQITSLLGGVRRWQKFLTAGVEGLSEERQRGLWGELHFLRDHLVVTFGPQDAVLSWQGSRAAHQDFLLSKGAVEIKTTTAKGPHVVQITSERQLDDKGLPALYLRHFALAVREGVGETLPQIVDSLRRQFQLMSTVADKFDDELLAAGYLDGHAWRYENRGYAVRKTNDFAVTGGFPRLTEAVLPPGIGKVGYTLSLDACRRFVLSPGKLMAALKNKSRARRRISK